jgi:two-component system phosphate regulon response regulator PhoB/two-component system alkaline phosphatase synthesis response regulator PhoP
MAKILVAEDDKFLSEAYRTKLVGVGFEVRLVVDGEEALKEFESFAPDIVILDLKMPKVDGFFFLETLKNAGKIGTVPVIVASNSGDKPDIERAMALGATDYVVKSNLSMKGLVEKINLLLHSKPPA